MPTFGDHGQEIGRIEAATKRLEDAADEIQREIKRVDRLIRKADRVAKYALIAALIAIGLSIYPIIKDFLQ